MQTANCYGATAAGVTSSAEALMAAWMVVMEGLSPTLGTTSSTATSKKGTPTPSAPAAPPRRRLPRALKLAVVAASIACSAHSHMGSVLLILHALDRTQTLQQPCTTSNQQYVEDSHVSGSHMARESAQAQIQRQQHARQGLSTWNMRWE